MGEGRVLGGPNRYSGTVTKGEHMKNVIALAALACILTLSGCGCKKNSAPVEKLSKSPAADCKDGQCKVK